MADVDLPSFLRGLPHFARLDANLIARLAAGCRARRVTAGESIFVEGAPCEAFFAIAEGAVRLYRSTADGREQAVNHLGPGATFAEAALLSFGKYPVSAATTEPGVVVEIPGRIFTGLLSSEPAMAPAVIASLCVRLMGLVERVEELSLAPAGERLARWLLRQPARGPAGRVEVQLALAKKDLAAHLAMTPETLSRLLRRWQDQGWIESHRAGLVLLDSGALVALSDGSASAT